jgi:N-acetylmuramoyl-L-alanine amidase
MDSGEDRGDVQMIRTGTLFRAELYDDKTPRLTIDQIYAKNKGKYADCDCYVFNFHWQNGDGSYCGNYRVNGVTLSEEYADCLGMGWSGNEKPVMGWWSKLKTKENFVCTMPMIYGGKKQDVSAAKYTSFVVRSCSRIAIGTDAAKFYVFANEVMTAEALRDKGAEMGLTDMLGGDSGGSTKVRGPGISYDNSDRFIYNYMVVWLKKGGGTTKYKVCLDAGHGGNEVSNGAPDGTYKEHEFTLDMAKRVRDLISPYVDVVMTREDNVTVSLTQRATIANNADANVFVSLHSNAAAGTGWSDAHGLCAYTYAAGGERDKLANAILDELGAAGVELRATRLNHAKFTVLASTKMPAVLVEYLFHNNREDVAKLKDSAFRDKLATATAKGICNYLGVAWDEDKPADTAHIYRVQAGAFTDRQNAESYKQKMIAAGFPGAFIVTD